MKQHLINHIAAVLDGSGSIAQIKHELGEVFDNLVDHLAKQSKSLDQETRLTVYRFSNTVECMYYDIDVLRIPKIGTDFYIGGSTALIDATRKAIEDLKLTPQIYSDHAFLLYALTDGENNISDRLASTLNKEIQSLPDNWTVAGLVPSESSVRESIRFGFPQANLKIWSTTGEGAKDVGSVIRQTTDSYMLGRSQGIRGTKTLFQLDTSKLNTNTIKTALQQLDPKQYQVLRVAKDGPIKEFVESWNKVYVPGSGYYQLMKPEKIQAYKQILVQDVKNGKLYGGADARAILGLPNHEVKVSPTSHVGHRIFVQSTSVNRKLIGGTELIVLK